MAKLAPKDPQFGIPVATRIRKELAFRFNKEAENACKTLSRYVAEFIELAVTREKQLQELQLELATEKATAAKHLKQVNELQTQLIKEKETTKKVAGRFILEITRGDKKETTQLIESYNTILKDEKRNS